MRRSLNYYTVAEKILSGSRNGHILLRNKKSTLLYDEKKATLYSFNETATYILSNLKKKASKSKIIGLMIQKYGISEKRAKRDFDSFIRNLSIIYSFPKKG